MECQKKANWKNLFNRLMISHFNQTMPRQRHGEVGKKSQYFESSYNRLGVKAGFNNCVGVDVLVSLKLERL